MSKQPDPATMKFVYDDGGRAAAGFKGKTNDCVTRAIAIATGKPYREVYDAINAIARDEHRHFRYQQACGSVSKRRKYLKSSARRGVFASTERTYLERIGWEWKPNFRKARLNELPSGRLIVVLPRHLVAVIEGVIHDTSCNSNHRVKGYWQKRPPPRRLYY